MKKIGFISVLLLVLVLTLSACNESSYDLALEDFQNASSGKFTIDVPGIYGNDDQTKEFNGDIIIACSDVTLKNLDIIGNLTFSEELGEGDADLENVNVSERVFVNGGGENSINVLNSIFNIVIINKISPTNIPVHLNLDINSLINQAIIQSNVILDAMNVDQLIINQPEDNTPPAVNLNGDFQMISVATSCTLTVSEDSTILNINFEAGAQNTNVLGGGSIETAQINANGININGNVTEIFSSSGIQTVSLNQAMTTPLQITEPILPTTTPRLVWNPEDYWDPEWGQKPENWNPNNVPPMSWEPGDYWDLAWGPVPTTVPGNGSDLSGGPDPLNVPPLDWEPGDYWNPEWGLEPQTEPGEGSDPTGNPDPSNSPPMDWQSGDPWDPAWGPEPDLNNMPPEIWQPGDYWDPRWGPEPDVGPGEGSDPAGDPDSSNAPPMDWQLGDPWDSAWGPEPQAGPGNGSVPPMTWQPGDYWDPSWGPIPDPGDYTPPAEVPPDGYVPPPGGDVPPGGFIPPDYTEPPPPPPE